MAAKGRKKAVRSKSAKRATSTDRQQWLYGSGGPATVPYGRCRGPILTNSDGVTSKSKHQGNGTAGSGKAAGCCPTGGGKVFIPPSSDPIWTA